MIRVFSIGFSAVVFLASQYFIWRLLLLRNSFVSSLFWKLLVSFCPFLVFFCCWRFCIALEFHQFCFDLSWWFLFDVRLWWIQKFVSSVSLDFAITSSSSTTAAATLQLSSFLTSFLVGLCRFFQRSPSCLKETGFNVILRSFVCLFVCVFST